MIRSCQEEEEGVVSQNDFPSNLNTENLKKFSKHGVIFIWGEDKALVIL